MSVLSSLSYLLGECFRAEPLPCCLNHATEQRKGTGDGFWSQALAGSKESPFTPGYP